ncbi:type II toxin-antitoxin system VapC family toxin [Candidatus Bathyarchaeota archaeon]|nr:type II toxin-antitoxin system VapC family toxin [Candidatus Bathyarchaeota archaeon]
MDSKSYIDVNVFVYWLGKHPTLGKTAYEWIKKIEAASKGRYITSSLTLYQTLIILAGLSGRSIKDKALVESIITPIENLPGLEVVSLISEDLIKAVKLMEGHRLDYEDALHLAVALRNKTKEIISNDEDFDTTPLKRKFY